jgi:hypothetical protein
MGMTAAKLGRLRAMTNSRHHFQGERFGDKLYFTFIHTQPLSCAAIQVSRSVQPIAY